MSSPIQELAERQTNEDILAPISKIPDEILLDIFMLVVEDEENPFFVTHICRYWREIAVGAPLLWVKPRTRYYECIKLMLERSDPADLDVVLESRMPMRTAQAIIDCMWRVGSLKFRQQVEEGGLRTVTPTGAQLDDSYVTALMPFVMRELRQRPRCLRSLTIQCFPSSDVNPLLQRLQPMDQLRHLSLTHVAFEWSIMPLPRLAHLNIQLAYASSPISTQELFGILGQMPLLQSLSFGQLRYILSRPPLPFSASAIPSQSSRTTLPLLRSLRLEDSTVDFALSFLTHMILPRLSRLEIGIEVHETFSDNAIFHDSIYTPLMRALTTTIKTGNFGVFERLMLGGRSFNLEAAEADDEDACGPASPGDGGGFGPSAIAIQYGRRYWNDIRIGGRVLGAMLMEDLIRLTCTPTLARITYIQIDDKISVATLEQLLKTRCFLALENLLIRDPGPYMSALTLLLAVALPQNIEDAPLIPFLQLRKIVFYFGRLKDVAPGVWKAFCDCLTLRKSVGNPLEEMFMDQCSITSEQISSLENAVNTVRHNC